MRRAIVMFEASASCARASLSCRELERRFRCSINVHHFRDRDLLLGAVWVRVQRARHGRDALAWHGSSRSRLQALWSVPAVLIGPITIMRLSVPMALRYEADEDGVKAIPPYPHRWWEAVDEGDLVQFGWPAEDVRVWRVVGPIAACSKIAPAQPSSRSAP